MQRTKKVLSLVLSLVMVLTMIPVISLNFTEPVKAYSDYSKPYSTEYYYASGTQFIYQLILYYSSSSNDAARNWLTNNGWTDWSGNFNAGDGSSSKYVHSGYKTTTDPTVAIKGILVADGHPSSVSYGGATYYAVGSGSIAQTPTGGDGCVDLNKGNGGDDLYLMATADRAAGPALTSITKSQSGSSGTAQSNLTNNGYRIVTDQSGNYQDTNAGAGGDYNYCGQKSSCSTVDSNTLRTNYATLLAKYNQISYYNYPSTTKANIEAALTNASNVLADLNDGYTTYSQSTINSYASNCSTQNGYMTAKAPAITRTTTVRDGVAGYYAYAYVDTNGGAPIARVQFPTWTNLNGQDDIQSNWSSNSAASGTSGSWTVNGSTYNYRYYVSVGSHNNEYEGYNTHIYAYNNLGAQVSSSANFGTFTYPVTYAGGGNTGGSTSAQTKTYGTNTAVSNNGFTRAYTVTYNGNSGTPGKTSDTATYTFAGWNATTSTQGYLINDATERSATGASGSYTEIAQWTIAQPFRPNEEYVLTFDAKGSGNLTTYFYGESGYLAVAKSVTGKGATSTGGDGSSSHPLTSSYQAFSVTWTLGSSGTQTVNKRVLFRVMGGNSATIKNVKFYQKKFVANSYMKNQSTSGTVTMTAQWNSAAVTLPNATRTGYDFNGWYTATSGGSRYGGNGTSYTPTANTTMYAQWTAYPYVVAFAGNGSTSGSMNNQNFVYGTAQNLTANAFTRAYTVTYNHNYTGSTNTTGTATATFNGWATSATGAKVYNDKQSVSNLTTTKNGNVTLFANWTLGTVTLPTPTRAGYTFKGWYKEAACTNLAGNGGASYTPTATTTLYAKWEASDNTITFNANGGTAVSQLSYKITDSKTLPSTTKNGYTFNNWKVTTAAGNWSANATFSAGDSVNGKYGNPTLTAQYTPRNYTVTYNVDGATSTAQYNIESTAKLPSQSKTGYDFAGWAISGNTGNWTETANLPANTALSGRWGDVTLTARWTPKTYGISCTLGDGASAANQPLSVEYDGSYTFTVTVDEAHDQNMPVVTATGATVSQTVNGNVITVTLSNVTGEVAVNVPTAINTYSFTLNGDEGFTSDDRAQTVDYGATVSFTVNLSDGYTQTAPTVKQGDTPLAPKTVNGSAYTYEIENVTSDITVDVTATLNVYDVSFDETNGASFADVEGAAIDIDNSVPATHGAPFRFRVTLAEGYTQTDPVVKVNGSTLAFASKTGDHTYNYEIESVTGAVEIETITTLNTYTVTWKNENGSEIKQTTVTHGSVPDYDGEEPTKASDDNYDYVFGGWDPVPVAANADASYTVVFTPQVREYAVKFVNEDGTVLQNEILPYGAMPEYKGSDPVKAATAQYTYTFKGWNNEIVTVTGPVTYTATFNATVNKYTVRFVNDGVQLQSEELEYGATPEYKGSDPEKEATAQYTYTFKEWTPEIATVTEDATYTATFNSTVNQYTVKFVNDDGTLLKEYTLDYGATPAYDGETPEKDPDAVYTYAFAGWGEIADVTADATYTATYTPTYIEYTIRFLNDNGDVLQNNALHYDDTPVYAGETPTKDPTAKYTYTFADWDKAIAPVTGDTDYTATYSSVVNKYTITFVNEDDTVLQSEEVAYDEVPAYNAAEPEKAATAQYSYRFNGWEPEVTAVTGNKTYKATFTSTVNKYDVEFLNYNGTVLQSESLAYGTTPEYKGATPVRERTAEFTYTFAGWNKEIEEVTADATYTATFSSETNAYTVRFVNDDGTELQSESLLYGAMPEYKGETPEKAATAQYTYTFKGWDRDISSVTGAVDYKATYSSVVNKYLITFTNEDGTVLQSGEIAYGETPVYEGETPEKAATAQYTYTFSGWNADIAPVTGEKTYNATYNADVNQYTVKFLNYDGSLLKEYVLDYGETPAYDGEPPEKENTAEFTYNFIGWDKDVASVTGDETYTAMFDNMTNSYSVKFVNDNGAVLQEETLLYGVLPEYKGETPQKARTQQYTYTFADWDRTIGRVTGDATYTATFTATVNKYTVTFVNFDGEKLDEQVLEYGATPVYGGEAPVKVPDADMHYAFNGWTVNTVTDDVTYTAAYTGAAHSWNAGAVKTPATCAAEGEMLHTCAVCGATKIEPIAIDPANHTGGTVLEGYVPASAEEHGYSGDTHCASCGALLATGEEIHRTKGACAYCGGYHEGVWGSVVTAVHGILWLIRQLFRIGG